MTRASQDSCPGVPGELPSYFTKSEKPYETDHVIQTLKKCSSLQIMHYDKSVLRS